MPLAPQDLSSLDRNSVNGEGACGHRPISSLDPRMHEALTDLHAYVLVLDAEWQRLGKYVEEPGLSGVVSPQSVQILRRRAEMTEELHALRATAAALRAIAETGTTF
jgi:hypothetical protein